MSDSIIALLFIEITSTQIMSGMHKGSGFAKPQLLTSVII